MNYFLKALQNYAVFSGRARRSEYWYFFLFYSIISFLASILDEIFDLKIRDSQGILSYLLSLALLIPTIAVSVRRMHDVNKSGWYSLIPIYNLILACTDGIRGSNDYGPDPKEMGF